ncbi:hypothetical protein IWQ56_004374 [Coemansia nantahalensis]|uniref:Uncharacterized protein n=1 Tax=Coemansia helicoidea TaxID=1286919 RepID=A0ACC1LFY0_9FUNG|nr:hypothetical protein IWQ56_004374 [Coemansia nantahalensis]KAJ2806823.1 hypothetical protein H4R21_000712 [Coemansia helicoidea]
MSVVTLHVESRNSASERRFPKAMTIGELRARLELMVGIPAGAQRLTLHNGDDLVCEVAGDERRLESFPADDYMVLRVAGAAGAGAAVPDYNDVSQVQKFEMEDAEYDKLGNTVRAFKRRYHLGRFGDGESAMSVDVEDEFEQEARGITAGSRCEVAVPGADLRRRGTVRFVGKTDFRRGYWVGVEYDEPVGKNDGTVDGRTYFTCAPEHGSFVRPDKVAVGDYPEEDPFASDLEEM